MAILICESIYLSYVKTLSQETQTKRKEFVAIGGLPDLAISTEATFIRHRSMSEVFSIYKDDGSLREYFPSTYAYSHSHIINKYTGSGTSVPQKGEDRASLPKLNGHVNAQ